MPNEMKILSLEMMLDSKFPREEDAIRNQSTLVNQFGEPDLISDIKKGYQILKYNEIELTYFRGALYLIKLRIEYDEELELKSIEDFITENKSKLKEVYEIDAKQVNVLLDFGLTAIFDNDRLMHLYREYRP